MVTANYQRGRWGVSPPATNGTVSELMHLPSLSMPWHQNTDWRIRRRREALLKTLHSQYLSACSGAYVLKKPPMYLSKASFCLITKLNYCAVPINQVWKPGVGRAHGAAGLPGQANRHSCGGEGGGGGVVSVSTLWLIPMAGCLVWGIHLDECAHTAFINVIPGQHDHIKPSQTDYCRRITHVNWQISFY